jgi:pimeloyl-ACP methyl ester carboxylesterase
MAQVEIRGMRIVYERSGAGPPLVLLHGLVGSGRSTWQRQLADLSDEFTVVAWDAPGAGRSADPPAWFRMPDYADCLAEFVHALGLNHPHVAGLSFGGAHSEPWRSRPPTLTSATSSRGSTCRRSSFTQKQTSAPRDSWPKRSTPRSPPRR